MGKDGQMSVKEDNSVPVRILQVVTYMGRGGLETMLMNYYRHMDRGKVQFDFLVHRDFTADYDQEILSLGGRIFRLPKLNPINKNYLERLYAFFKEHQEYKVVHSHLDCMAGIPLKAAKKYGVPVCIAHAHSSNQDKDIKYLLKLLYKRTIPNYADFLFACSQEAGNWMFNGVSFWILNNAIDAGAYTFNEKKREKVRLDLGIDPDTFVIGHVGRFSPVKNHEMLLDVFSVVQSLKPNSKLLLVGTGDMMEKTVSETIRRGMQNKVIFTGLRTDVPELLQAMDVFVFPSINEGLPLSVVEAQAAGLPCLISSGVPGECRKTDLVVQKKLSDGAGDWAREVIRLGGYKRENTLKEIQESGFDVALEARKLGNFYLSCYENQNHKEKIQWLP